LRKILNRCIVFLILVLLSNSLFAQQDWKLVKDENGIKVYSRMVPGSAIKELKTVAKINANAHSLVAVLADVTAQPKYVYSCIESKLLSYTNKQKQIYYQHIYVPWPLTNRDGVFFQQIQQDSITKIITVSAKLLPGYVPTYEDRVRIPKMNSVWTIYPDPNGGIIGEYYISINPGGDVPSWIVNLFIEQAPIESVAQLRKVVELPEYKHAKLPFLLPQ
jgi:hypothetical protein